MLRPPIQNAGKKKTFIRPSYNNKPYLQKKNKFLTNKVPPLFLFDKINSI
jgi:hypothetical protein